MLCSVFDLESESKWDSTHLSSWDILKVHLGSHGGLNSLVELPLEGSFGQTGVVNSEFKGMIILLELKAELGTESLLSIIVVHLASCSVASSGVVEIKGRVSWLNAS